MAEWKDTTSYSQGDKERTPDCWSITTGEVRIVVMRNHRMNPGFWTMHAYGLGIDTLDLKLPSDEPESLAKFMAINVAASKARDMVKDIQSLQS